MSGATPLASRRALAARLRASGIGDADLDARFLVEAASAEAGPDDALGPAALEAIEAFAQRRLGGEPVFRILGEREFWGLPFRLSPGTLEPRSDTETLVDAALAAFGDRRSEPLRVLDLGTGSGCLLVATLHEFPRATGIGIDRSVDAAMTARFNAIQNRVDQRARFLVGDWSDALVGEFGLILSNPPYIPAADIAQLSREVRDHDPRNALDGGSDGLDAYRRLALQLPSRLARAGRVILEIGAGQAGDVAAIMSASELRLVEARRDLGGHERALVFANARDQFGETQEFAWKRA